AQAHRNSPPPWSGALIPANFPVHENSPVQPTVPWHVYSPQVNFGPVQFHSTSIAAASGPAAGGAPDSPPTISDERRWIRSSAMDRLRAASSSGSILAGSSGMTALPRLSEWPILNL